MKIIKCNTKIKSDIREISISITNKCNFNCSYCCGAPKGNYFIPISYVKMFLCNYKKLENSPIRVGLSGGEPTLHPDIFDIIKTISKYECVKKIAVFSNGTGSIKLYEDILNISKKCYIKLSFHPNNKFSRKHYINLFSYFYNHDRFIIKFILDYINLDDLKKDIFELLEEDQIYTYVPLFNTDTKKNNRKYNKNIIDFFEQKGIIEKIDVKYEDGTVKYISDFDFLSDLSFYFKGYYCNSFDKAWIIEKDNIHCMCYKQINGNYIFEKSFKNFLNKILTMDKKCFNDKCLCGNNFHQSINKIRTN